MIEVKARKQELDNSTGYNKWVIHEDTVMIDPAKTALVIVDMWDKHWCTGANERGGPLAEKINELAKRLRDKGFLIVHAPSDTMKYYENAQARKRLLAASELPPIDIEHEVPDYDMPIDASDHGSDTPSRDAYPPNTKVWSRQTDKIAIDQDKDILCGEDGELLSRYLHSKGIQKVIYVGVHTNMCVLNRSFAIKAMLSRKLLDVYLVRDLTDCMYNPGRPPYVSHDEGTRLTVEYIEKFYCPTLLSSQLL